MQQHSGKRVAVGKLLLFRGDVEDTVPLLLLRCASKFL